MTSTEESTVTKDVLQTYESSGVSLLATAKGSICLPPPAQGARHQPSLLIRARAKAPSNDDKIDDVTQPADTARVRGDNVTQPADTARVRGDNNDPPDSARVRGDNDEAQPADTARVRGDDNETQPADTARVRGDDNVTQPAVTARVGGDDNEPADTARVGGVDYETRLDDTASVEGDDNAQPEFPLSGTSCSNAALKMKINRFEHRVDVKITISPLLAGRDFLPHYSQGVPQG
jgi:hypothetical protein